MAPVLACNIQAISAAQRPRYNELVSRLRAAIGDRRELPHGYDYSLDSAQITLPELSEWITLERLCCPFLIFKLAGAGEAVHLTMRGPDGAKAILREAFPVRGEFPTK
jgi:hypothetical protein